MQCHRIYGANMSDLHVAAIRALEAGKSYRVVGKEFGFHWQSVRRLLLKYQREGIERIQAIKLHPLAGTSSLTPDDEYNRRWMDRLKERTTTNDKGCFLWTGPVTTKGYPSHAHRKWRTGGHRIAYMIMHGVQLEKDQFVCHSCDQPNCWNPAHLWIGDALTNQQDKNAKRRNYFTNKTHCRRGHEFTPENTHIRAGQAAYNYGPSRVCKECARINGRTKWRQKRANKSQVTL